MIGQRIAEEVDDGRLFDPQYHGAYWLTPRGWEALTPNGLLANLSKHSVIEHEDGTITVSPSIECMTAHNAESRTAQNYWHGFLERGVWREC